MLASFVVKDEAVRPYLNRICSIGSYRFILYNKGGKHLSLVDDAGPLGQSVINGRDALQSISAVNHALAERSGVINQT